ncbi:MAG: oxidoreductase [Campylobacterota bacterium]|nr:oxidoreductase [Campylobacterota bacterium]
MLKDKVIVVTGGAGLIGREFIKAIIEQKGIAIIADINEDIGLKVKISLSKELNSNNINFIKLDITSKSSLDNCIKYLDKKYGRIDAIVNNAYPRNKNYGNNLFDIEYDDFVENTGLNIGGYFITSQQFALYFKIQGYGNIINISSIYGVIAPRFEIYKNTSMTMPVEYAGFKSAIIHLTKYMAKYFKNLNIRVNTLSSGGIFDNQPKEFLKKYEEKCLNKGMLDKSDLKGSLIYLLSDMSKYVNGQNIIVDDGFTL